MNSNLDDLYNSLYDNLSPQLPEGSCIAIYGIGNAAFEVHKRLSEHYFVLGFLDRDPQNIGKEIFGLKIIELDEALKKSRAVIIAANPMYWNNIAKRINSDILNHGVKLFFTDGNLYCPEDNSGYSDNEYWKVSIEQLEDKCQKYDIISFDLFDTLLMRKIAYPTDLFSLMEIKATAFPGRTSDFAQKRRQAEMKCASEFNDIYTLNQIYCKLSEDLKLSKEQEVYLKNLELELERLLLTPRHDIIELFKKLVSQNKRIFIVSDMYLSSDILADILSKFNISGYEKIFVSCQEGATKQSGELWKKVIDFTGHKKILHIGDNITADINMARSCGLDAFYVMRPVDMLAESSCGEIVSKTLGIGESISTGLINTRLCNSPFSLYNKKGRPEIISHEDFGYIFFGPMTFSFLAWFFEGLKNYKPDIVLLFARDGYFIKKLYDIFKTKYSFEWLPERAYFKTSRRMSVVSTLYCEEDVFNSLKKTFTGTLKDFLKIRFGLDIDFHNDEKVISSSEKRSQEEIRKYMPQILENAERERECFLHYISTVLPKDCKKIASFDLGFNGTIQFNLQKLLKEQLKGYYLFYTNTGENLYYQHNDAEALYFKADPKGKDNNFGVFKNYPLLESVFTAPEGTYLKIDTSGEFEIDSNSNNNPRFCKIEEIHRGIEAFIYDYMEIVGNDISIFPNKNYSDAVLDTVNFAKINKSIQETCRFEDSYRGIKGLKSVFE